MAKVIVLFQVRYENTNWGDAIYLCGNCPELGNWNQENAIRLDCRDANWYAYVAIEPDKPIEYKYFFRNAFGSRWEATTHKRRFNVKAGEIVEARDRWHDEPDFIQDVASTSFIKDVCMRREHPQPMPTVERPAGGDITIVFEVNVPLVSPQESVRLIGQSKKVPFWRIAESQVLSDLDCPVFRGARTFKPAEMPVRYKFVLSHDLGWECENIELGEDNQCFAPRHFDVEDSDASVFITDENPVPHRIPIKEAIAKGICTKPDADYIQIIYIESNSFRYPRAPEFRAAGMVLPVFSMRTKKSLGIGEFTDIIPLAQFCQKAGLRLLQLLPITDTTVNFVSWLDSYPYSSTSSFALHPIYMNIDSLEPLPEDIKAALPDKRKELDLPQVDYEATLHTKLEYMQKIFQLHTKQGLLEKDPEFAKFQEESSYWLNSYCAFKALAELHKTTNWQDWPEEHREESTLKKLVEDMNKPGHPQYEVVMFNKWIQYHLDKQLKHASQECATKYHVGLKGDVPIGVDPRSTDAWYFRRYFKLNTKAGAPPDAFAQYGQNWGFPTYNWSTILEDNFEWWANRLKVMGRFFHAYRVDHILGFFRIWEIPASVVSGLHARFFPGYTVSDDELHRRGLNNNVERLTRPIITYDMVREQFGEEADTILERFLEPTQYSQDGQLQFKKEFSDEVSILEEAKKMKNIGTDSDSQALADFDVYMRKFWILTNSVCLYSYGNGQYVPRFDVRATKSCQLLGPDWQNALQNLAEEYFHKWHQDQWEWSAIQKFPRMKEASNMLICGEDLGLLSPIVPKVMNRFHILGLRVQRMTGDPAYLYYHPKEYSTDVVATTSTHDMPPLRAWWSILDDARMTDDEKKWFWNTDETREEIHVRDLFWYKTLGNTTPRPRYISPDQVERIVDMHMYSPAMLAMFPYQDLMAISPDQSLYHKNPWDEVINIPAIRNHYWRYRIPPHIEDLLEKEELIDRIRGKILDSGRLRAH